MSDVMIQVEVAYALPEKQMIIPLTVKKGTTMFDAVVQSGIADKFEGLDINSIPMGVFGKAERKPKERVLEEGERVELYRPLIADPKEVRKKRAAKKAAGEE
ncbi:RnfH family protein [Ketobacter sp.]|uniref:RnfH family protein n=1 Tax=Ketobacter sp. TaxID=2083498 RepID=UPI000F147D5C|nr:RnfH family protein [Ketobacter sp.]RLT99346.1 MAG: RnfH family protein [Ketobacter sp.]